MAKRTKKWANTLGTGKEVDILPTVAGIVTYIGLTSEYGPVATFYSGVNTHWVIFIPTIIALPCLIFSAVQKRFGWMFWLNVFWFLAPIALVALLYWFASGISTPAL